MAMLAVDRQGTVKHNGRPMVSASPHDSLFGISRKEADKRRDLVTDVERARLYLAPEQDEMAELIMGGYSLPEIARSRT
jgi:hypothetical protein